VNVIGAMMPQLNIGRQGMPFKLFPFETKFAIMIGASRVHFIVRNH
jgi:hypothetical protein